MKRRNLASAAVLSSIAGLVAQGYFAGHRELPSFPNLDASGVVAADASSVGQHRITVVLLGDSTLTGPGLLHPSEIWVRQIAARMNDIELDLRSVAVGGSRAAAVRREQLPAALAHRPDVAIVSVGSNDSIRGVPVSLFRSELRVIVDSLTAAGAIVALAGIGDLATIPRLPQPLATVLKARSNSFERVHDELARGRPDVVKLPIRDLASEAFRTRPGMFCPDLFHPSSRGHAAWADAAHGTLVRAVGHVARNRHAKGTRECAD
jgi:lysophospholipase L1-like esterase